MPATVPHKSAVFIQVNGPDEACGSLAGDGNVGIAIHVHIAPGHRAYPNLWKGIVDGGHHNKNAIVISVEPGLAKCVGRSRLAADKQIGVAVKVIVGEGQGGKF